MKITIHINLGTIRQIGKKVQIQNRFKHHKKVLIIFLLNLSKYFFRLAYISDKSRIFIVLYHLNCFFHFHYKF